MSNTEQIQVPKTAKEKALSLKERTMQPNFLEALNNALPKQIKADFFARALVTAMTTTPKLAKCTPESFFSSALKCASFGLIPNGREAHLIPYENKRLKIVECQLQMDYKGLATLALRSPEVSVIHADKVCENDEFTVVDGIPSHTINYRQPRGEVYAYYAKCIFKDGGIKGEVMTLEEVEEIRNGSQAWRAYEKYGTTCPWNTQPDEMGKKTVFKRLSKWLPLTPEIQEVIKQEDARDYPKSADVVEPSSFADLMGNPEEESSEEAQETEVVEPSESK